MTCLDLERDGPTVVEIPAGCVPGKGWFAIFRLYGPLDAWFDKTWRPGEIEPVP
ncbi:MAG: hypothetical protein K8T26_08200 [Lentisphaerae bacterium]|nr:hypothetical protein [Lentisphaerota bacterium]